MEQKSDESRLCTISISKLGGVKYMKKYQPGEFDVPEVTRPFYLYFFLILSIPSLWYYSSNYIRFQNSRHLFAATGNFEYTNRIAIRYGSDVFEIDSSHYNFDDLKTLLNPLGGRSYSLIRIDMSEHILYLEIDYFIDDRRVFTASIYKISGNLTVADGNRFIINNRQFSLDGYIGLLFITNYNRNVLSRFFTRTMPLSSLKNNELNIYKVLELLRTYDSNIGYEVF